ncbi:DUF1684 domain-containing protein [Kitasatospora sp. NBC_01250]|uniref:DUF1684 domain-containing protein n=1 Tax=unclassified Kitasatospora TaxID=2633591 RepID=UPI002E100958|nr:MULTISPECIES: DUF1684 domain-containing protein [unclassified Kitasatospora]WSJ66768.1 DUF1684 domain-containing protein [Kitasatospora sp. NBC_01302]
MTTDAEEWQRWTEARVASVSAPHGVLALTGTHWLSADPAAIPGVPGRWSAEPDGVRVSASAADGLRGGAGDEVVAGEPLLRPDTHPEAAVVRYGEVLLIPIEREGELALRVFDPDAEGRVHFAGISTFPYAPEWSVPAVFTPYETGARTVTVPNADGRERPLAVAGQVAFRLAGESYSLTVSHSGDQLSAVFADAGSGRESYRFRFITLPGPDAEGHTVLDLNRAYLPPCAFADHFICPFPPPGNRLPVAVRAGEKAVLSG